MDKIFRKLGLAIEKAKKSVGQLAVNPGSRATVIVKPQLSKSAEDAEELAKNWHAREQKQLFDNLSKALR